MRLTTGYRGIICDNGIEGDVEFAKEVKDGRTQEECK